ncbi:hypothetical protein [Mesorhizobium sp. B2-4-17]|uniref:hypothetical protein n=1 Tax=Mesorhizobium sp. B2-4-17 TaxID=2589932 RepID=UPI00112A67CC|nr:hypothetical protein [Mesorhizobium sp. B2-4-17]TPK87362.1 hypothetical protein FJ548_14285 [Mesorhizobium sp. B2-4-17]
MTTGEAPVGSESPPLRYRVASTIRKVLQAVPKLRDAARPAGYSEPLTWPTLGDWVFVGFGWLTIAWAVFITVDKLSGNEFVGFDYLPVAAGVPIIVAGWPALRTKSRIETAVDGLSGGAGLDLNGDIAAFELALHRRVRLWSVVSGAAIALCFGGFLFWSNVNKPFDNLYLFALLLIVCVGVGFVIGMLLGRLLGYGQILIVMRETGIAIGRIDTEQARTAISQMENVLRFAFFVTVGMCHWFALWFAVWTVGLWIPGIGDGRGYQIDYWVLFIALWVVSFGFYLFAARGPMLAFQARLDALQGGLGGQGARQRQLAEAQDDLRRLKTEQRSDSFDEEQELAALVREFDERRAPTRLPSRWVLDLLAVWIAVLLTGSIVLSLRGDFNEPQRPPAGPENLLLGAIAPPARFPASGSAI